MSGHTPGPWFVAPSIGDVVTVYALTDDHDGSPRNRGLRNRMTIQVTCSGNPGEAMANGILGAAAPDLLAALRNITDDYADRFDMDDPSTNPGIKQAVRQSRAAIAKATGGGGGS